MYNAVSIEEVTKDTELPVISDKKPTRGWFQQWLNFHIADLLEPRDSDENTILHLAARYGRHDIIFDSLKHLKSLKLIEDLLFKKNKNGKTALTVAAEEGKMESICTMLNSLNESKRLELLQKEESSNNRTALHCLIRGSEEEIDFTPIFTLLEKSSWFNLLRMVDSNGYTAIHYAAEKDYHHSVINDMLKWVPQGEAKEILKICNHDDATALHIAAENGCNSCMVIMLRAVPDENDKLKILRIENKIGETALHSAMSDELGSCITTILNAVKVSERYNYLAMQSVSKETAVHMAARIKSDSDDQIKSLLDCKLEAEEKLKLCAIKNDYGLTPLEIATSHNEPVMKFLSKCASDSSRRKAGKGQKAGKDQFTETVQELKKKNATLNSIVAKQDKTIKDLKQAKEACEYKYVRTAGKLDNDKKKIAQLQESMEELEKKNSELTVQLEELDVEKKKNTQLQLFKEAWAENYSQTKGNLEKETKKSAQLQESVEELKKKNSQLTKQLEELEVEKEKNTQLQLYIQQLKQSQQTKEKEKLEPLDASPLEASPLEASPLGASPESDASQSSSDDELSDTRPGFTEIPIPDEILAAAQRLCDRVGPKELNYVVTRDAKNSKKFTIIGIGVDRIADEDIQKENENLDGELDVLHLPDDGLLITRQCVWDHGVLQRYEPIGVTQIWEMVVKERRNQEAAYAVGPAHMLFTKDDNVRLQRAANIQERDDLLNEIVRAYLEETTRNRYVANIEALNATDGVVIQDPRRIVQHVQQRPLFAYRYNIAGGDYHIDDNLNFKYFLNDIALFRIGDNIAREADGKLAEWQSLRSSRVIRIRNDQCLANYTMAEPRKRIKVKEFYGYLYRNRLMPQQQRQLGIPHHILFKLDTEDGNVRTLQDGDSGSIVYEVLHNSEKLRPLGLFVGFHHPCFEYPEGVHQALFLDKALEEFQLSLVPYARRL